MMRNLSRIVVQPSGDLILLDQWKEVSQLIPSSEKGFPITHIGLHEGEEPFLTGEGALVAVYFEKCNLKCKDCTNDPQWKIANYPAEDLIATISRYVQKGGKSVSFVSPTIYY